MVEQFKRHLASAGIFFSLVLLLVTLPTVPVKAETFLQSVNVTVSAKNQTIKQVLSQIEHQTKYLFIADESVNLSKVVTVERKNVPLKTLLAEVLTNNGYSYRIDGHHVIVSQKGANNKDRQATGRKTKVSGTVKDENGAALMGATIRVEGTNIGTVADMNGNYTLENVPEGARLIVSYIGKEDKKVSAQSNRNNDVMLSDMGGMLEDVVVTGYQEIAKAKITGASTTIRTKDLDSRYATNVMDNLEGRVAGLSTYGGKMTIRGTSSLFAETNPLLVVDGLPIEGTIDDINPYDIETINVLKDAAATAIYGARASNGIIVITTKNASKESKMDINFSADLTIFEKKNVDYSDNFFMNAQQQINVEKEYYDYFFFNNDGDVADPISYFNSLLQSGIEYISPIGYAYYEKALGNKTQAEIDQLLNKLGKNNYAKEFSDEIYRQQVLQQYNFSLRSRSQKGQHNITVNYKSDNSGQINSYNKQLNLNYKGALDIAKWLTATVSVNSIFNKTRKPGDDHNSYHTSPWYQPAYETMYNEDGSIRKHYYGYNGMNGNAYWDGLPSGYGDMGINPVDEFYNNVVNTNRNHNRYHGELQFKIIDGLTANAQIVYEESHATEEWIANEDSHAAITLRNAYTVRNTDGSLKYLVPNSGGFKRESNTTGKYLTSRYQLNYSNTFQKHAITAIAGLEFRDTKLKGSNSLYLGYSEQMQNSSTQTIDFATISTLKTNTNIMQAGGGFPSREYAFDPYIDNSMKPVTEEHHRFGSGYANLTYTYDDKYNVFASFRKDYADVYGLNAKFRGKPLWSVGAGWNIHEENFMKDIQWVNFLKLRVSYGVTGNIYQGATSYMTATSGSINYQTNQNYGKIESPANPDLRWEQNRTTDIGIDFSFLGNRFSGSLDYYHKEGRDLFSYKSLETTTGFKSMFMNMASMSNKGVELQLNATWLRPNNKKAIGWTTSITYAHNNNKVTSVENPSTLASERWENGFVEGYPSSAIWSARFAGISDAEGQKGMTLWYGNGDTKIHSISGESVEALVFSGQTEPKVSIGMDNALTWNGLKLDILLAYYGGHKMLALPENEFAKIGMGEPLPSYFLNAWTPENKTNTPGIGRYGTNMLNAPTEHSDISVRPADFLKIRNIVLSYALPEKWLNNIGINQVTLRAQLDNPKYLWVKNKVGVDPETLGLRNPSSFIFGINVNL